MGKTAQALTTGKGRGRKTRLTPEIQDRIISLVTAGHYKRTAAAQAGVAERTLYQWYDKGEPNHPSHRRVYAQFRQALDKAEADSEVVLLGKIMKEGSARDFLEVLARRFPERWARRIDVGLGGDPKRPIHHEHEHTHGGTVESAVRIVIASTEDTWQPNDDPGFYDAPAETIETTADK